MLRYTSRVWISPLVQNNRKHQDSEWVVYSSNALSAQHVFVCIVELCAQPETKIDPNPFPKGIWSSNIASKLVVKVKFKSLPTSVENYIPSS